MRRLGLLLGSLPRGLHTQSRSSQSLKHTNRTPKSRGAVRRMRKKWLGLRFQQICQGWSRASCKGASGFARVEPEAQQGHGNGTVLSPRNHKTIWFAPHLLLKQSKLCPALSHDDNFQIFNTQTLISALQLSLGTCKQSIFCSGSQSHRVPVEEASAEPALIELMGCSARDYLEFQAAPI